MTPTPRVEAKTTAEIPSKVDLANNILWFPLDRLLVP